MVSLHQNYTTLFKINKTLYAFDNLSSTNHSDNSKKLQLAMLAYNFNDWFIRLVL